MAYITITDVTFSSVSAKVEGLHTDYNQTLRTISWEAREGSITVSTASGNIPNQASESSVFTMSGLSPSTEYAIMCTIDNIHNYGSVTLGTDPVKTKSAPGPVRPNNWTWSPSIVKGMPVNISASHWNSFTNRINQFRVYKGLSNYSFTLAVSNTAITAAIVNQAITAINGLSAHYSQPLVSKGDPLTADLFNSLRDLLNVIQ